MKTDYPPNWKDISNHIRFERAGGKCEDCGLAHNTLIVRSSIDGSRYLVYNESDGIHYTPDGKMIRMSEIPDEFDGPYVRVELSVHHLGIEKPDGSPGDPEDKADCREENLKSLCARCHFQYEIPGAKAGRKRKKTEREEEARREYEKRQMTIFDLPGIDAT